MQMEELRVQSSIRVQGPASGATSREGQGSIAAAGTDGSKVKVVKFSEVVERREGGVCTQSEGSGVLRNEEVDDEESDSGSNSGTVPLDNQVRAPCHTTTQTNGRAVPLDNQVRRTQSGIVDLLRPV